MIAQPLRISGFTRVPHIEMIALIRDAINSSGGSIFDSYMYSNAMLCVNFEIGRCDVTQLAQALLDAGLLLSADSAAQLGDFGVSSAESGGTVPGALSVNFIHDDPPLRIEVPAVPG